MKEKLNTAPILRVPDPQKKLVVITDGSRGVGGVLMQDEQVIAYESRKLMKYEQNCALMI